MDLHTLSLQGHIEQFLHEHPVADICQAGFAMLGQWMAVVCSSCSVDVVLRNISSQHVVEGSLGWLVLVSLIVVAENTNIIPNLLDVVSGAFLTRFLIVYATSL